VTYVTEEVIVRALDTWPSRWDLLGGEYDRRDLVHDTSYGLSAKRKVVHMPSWLATLFMLTVSVDPIKKATRRWRTECPQEARDGVAFCTKRVRAVLDALQAQPDVFLGLDDNFALSGSNGLVSTYVAFL